MVVGNFLKRLCTVGWAITALIALALLAGNTELATDPDLVWELPLENSWTAEYGSSRIDARLLDGSHDEFG